MFLFISKKKFKSRSLQKLSYVFMLGGGGVDT